MKSKLQILIVSVGLLFAVSGCKTTTGGWWTAVKNVGDKIFAIGESVTTNSVDAATGLAK